MSKKSWRAWSELELRPRVRLRREDGVGVRVREGEVMFYSQGEGVMVVRVEGAREGQGGEGGEGVGPQGGCGKYGDCEIEDAESRCIPLPRLKNLLLKLFRKYLVCKTLVFGWAYGLW